MAILDAKKEAANGLLSKIVIGEKTYEIKDVLAREAIDALSYISASGAFEGGNTDTAIKNYIDAQVGAINKFDVVVLGAGENLPVASVDTMYKLYLKPDGQVSGSFVEYITVRSGSEGAYTYVFEQIGTTAVDLEGYVTDAELATEWAKLKALAFKDSATGTVPGQTISGVKATGTSAGSIAVALTETESAVKSTGKFTPTGNITGSATASGAAAVTHTSANAALTKGDYTPAGDVTVTLSGATFNKITSVGSQASFTEGTFTPATLEYAAAEGSFATEGIVGTVADETLTFTAAGVQAIAASKINSFAGGSKAKDTFTTNSLPTMEENTVGVATSSFTGAKAEQILVTGVAYDKADATANVTGAAVDISKLGFTGIEGDVSVKGQGKAYAVDAAHTKFTGTAIELAVGDIAVADTNVTVQ